MAPVQGGDPLLAVPFGQGDQAGVGAAQAQVGVTLGKVVDALPVLDREGIDVQVAVKDHLVEQCFGVWAEVAVEQVGGLGDHHRGGDQGFGFGLEQGDAGVVVRVGGVGD